MNCDACGIRLEPPIVLYGATTKRDNSTGLFRLCCECRKSLRCGEEVEVLIHFDNGILRRETFVRHDDKATCDGCGELRHDVNKWDIGEEGAYAIVCDDCEQKLRDDTEIEVMTHHDGKDAGKMTITLDDERST